MDDAVPLLKFTPSAQDPRILEEITVQREPLVAALVESALDLDGGLRHHLLVGPRGIGKTHILSLVASRLRDTDGNAEAFVLAWLDEDPWAIRGYDKLLAAIVARIAEESKDAELARDAAELRASGDAEGGLHGEELLCRAAGERRVVLLAENLDEVFRRIGPGGQARLRAFAEDWGQLLVFATTPQLFAGVQRHASPFYGFFAVTHMDELSLENATELLRRIARLRRDDELLRFLGTDVAAQRLAAIEALAGGHPRIWLLLAGCISIAAIDELVPLFLEALDDLTPYYQDRLRELSSQQQEIVVLLSEAGGALSNRVLSERSGIPPNQVATMLRQLTDRGYVRRAELPEGLASGDRRISYWELREPLMRLCLDVKHARGEPLKIVVAFLRAWYGPRLLDELDRLPATARLATEYATEAFRTLPGLELDELLEGTPDEILARAERGLSVRPEDVELRFAKVIALADRETVDIAGLVDAACALRDSDPDVFGAWTLIGLAFRLAGRDEDVAAAFARAQQLDPEDPMPAAERGKALRRLGRNGEALEAFSTAAELAPHVASFHYERGVTLIYLGRDERALQALTRSIEIDGGIALPHDRRALVLARLGRFEEALAAVERAVELEPDDGLYRDHRGILLGYLGRDEEALAAFAEAVEVEPDAAGPRHSQASLLRRLGRLGEAEAAARQALALSSDSERTIYRFTLAAILLDRGDVANALGVLRQALLARRERRNIPPGDTALLSRILWKRFRGDPRRPSLIAQLVEAYREADAIDWLARGLVRTIPLFVDDAVSLQEADAWVEDWAQAPFGRREIAVAMLEAAREWKRDRDQAHLLALPREQRTILVGLLQS